MDCLPDKNVIGGAPFNVVTHIKRLGESSGIISKIGTDELGGEIADFLKTEKIDQFVQKDSSYKTGYVTVKFIEGQPNYTIHSGCGWEFLDFENTASPEYFVFGSLALHFPKNKESFFRLDEKIIFEEFSIKLGFLSSKISLVNFLYPFPTIVYKNKSILPFWTPVNTN